MIMLRSVVIILFVCLGVATITCGQRPPAANYDESRVGQYTLPDPLVFNDGTPVRTAADWTKRRRAEILELFATNVYGHSPAKPRNITYEVFDNDTNALGGKAIRKQVTIYFSPSRSGPREEVLIYIPKNAPKPVPVFLLLSFAGNQTVSAEPQIKTGVMWNPKTREKQAAPEDSRGRMKEETERVLSRGYAFAAVNYADIEPDFNGGYVSGIRPLFFKPGQSSNSNDEWGAIGAWSYGLSRIVDYFESDKDIDARRVAIVGHSRLGKTALWTGALDQRIALVISSCSGEGGASLSRRDYGERISNLTWSFPYWFAKNYKNFAERVDQLPVDMHELIALIAPRPVYITGGETDLWADPKGEFLAAVGAGPVFRLLGKEDLGTDQMPELDQPIMKTIGFHIHSGGHAITPFDWEQFLTFADKNFKR